MFDEFAHSARIHAEYQNAIGEMDRVIGIVRFWGDMRV